MTLNMAKLTNCGLQYVYIWGRGFTPIIHLSMKGGSIYPGLIHCGSFLLIKIAYEEYSDKAERFSLNFFSFTPGLQNPWSNFSFVWFSGDKYPLDPTSKHVRVGVRHTISVKK